MNTFLDALDRWSGPALPSHPRCFFDREGLKALQDRASGGGGPWPALLAHAREIVAHPVEPVLKEHIPDGGALELAFAWKIWGEPAFLEAARRQVAAAIAAPSWVTHPPLRIDLCSCMVTSCLALVCDLLRDDLESGERERLEERILARDLAVYADIAHRRAEWWTECRMNWQGVIHGHIGIAALALLDRLPRAREILRLATAGVLGFLDSQPADGSSEEGLQYWHFGAGETAWFALALKTVTRGEVDLFRHPHFAASRDFLLHMSTPSGCFDYGDCVNFRPTDWLTALLARELRDPVLQALVAPPDPARPPSRKIDAPAAGMRFVLSHDTSLPPASPASLPLSRAFTGSRTVCMRSGWDEKATAVSIQAASAQRPHGHADAGSFIIESRGERLVPDAGFWPYGEGFFDKRGPRWDFDGAGPVGHSVVFVEDPALGALPAPLVSVELGGAADLVVCDLASANAAWLSRHVRYFAFLRPDTVLVFDDIEATEPVRPIWNLLVGGEPELCGDRVEFRKGAAAASVVFLNLDRPAGYSIASETRHAFFNPKVDDGRWPLEIRRVHVTPLHALERWRFGAVIFTRSAAEPPSGQASFSLAADGIAHIRCTSPEGTSAIDLDLNARRISVRR